MLTGELEKSYSLVYIGVNLMPEVAILIGYSTVLDVMLSSAPETTCIHQFSAVYESL